MPDFVFVSGLLNLFFCIVKNPLFKTYSFTPMRTTLYKNLRQSLFIFQLIFISLPAKSQMVFIPDTAFRNWIISAAPGSMNGDSLNTTHPAVTGLSSAFLGNINIQDISG